MEKIAEEKVAPKQGDPEKNNGWISVDEELPPMMDAIGSGLVLCRVGENAPFVGWVTTNGVWYDTISGKQWKKDPAITHWRYLPDGPTQRKDI